MSKVVNVKELEDGDTGIIESWEGPNGNEAHGGKLVQRHGDTLVTIGGDMGQRWTDILTSKGGHPGCRVRRFSSVAELRDYLARGGQQAEPAVAGGPQSLEAMITDALRTGRAPHWRHEIAIQIDFYSLFADLFTAEERLQLSPDGWIASEMRCQVIGQCRTRTRNLANQIFDWAGIRNAKLAVLVTGLPLGPAGVNKEKEDFVIWVVPVVDAGGAYGAIVKVLRRWQYWVDPDAKPEPARPVMDRPRRITL